MKVCPQCQNTYTDDTLQFCLQDGAPLNQASSSTQLPTMAWNEEPETLVRAKQEPVRINLQEAQPTQPQIPQTTQQTDFQPATPKKSKAWIFVLLGLFLLLGIGGLGAVGIWFYLNPGGQTVVQNPNTNTGINNSKPINTVETNTNVNTNANVNANVATPTPKPILKPAEIEAAKKEAESVVYGWKSAAENHNLDTNLSNYADTVDYYKVGKVGKSKVRANKEPAYKKYDTIVIEIENMKVAVDPTGEKATVTFDKTWDFTGTDKDGNDLVNRGQVQQQLIMNRVNGKWKIVSEKELKVYYIDKGDGDDY